MMMYLLQNCSLYVKLDQGCLLQVTGMVYILTVLSFTTPNLQVLPLGLCSLQPAYHLHSNPATT